LNIHDQTLIIHGLPQNIHDSAFGYHVFSEHRNYSILISSEI